MDLIETLGSQHEAIEDLVKRVRRALADEDRELLKRELAAFRVAVVAHLEIEDRRLYPELTAAAATMAFDVPIQITQTYQRNMEQISASLMAFFGQHEQVDTEVDLVAFRRDWGLVSQLLAHRIESEELTLYPLYRSLVEKRR